LEDLLGRPVDLVMETAVENSFFRAGIDRSRQSSAWLWEVRLATDSIAALVQGRGFADCAAAVWQTIDQDLPALRVQIEALLVRLGITRNGSVDQLP